MDTGICRSKSGDESLSQIRLHATQLNGRRKRSGDIQKNSNVGEGTPSSALNQAPSCNSVKDKAERNQAFTQPSAFTVTRFPDEPGAAVCRVSHARDAALFRAEHTVYAPR